MRKIYHLQKKREGGKKKIIPVALQN